MPAHDYWTEERMTRLAELWGKGLSGAQCAAELGGVTRNAVIGKAFRMGLGSHGKVMSAHQLENVKQARAEKRKAANRDYVRAKRAADKPVVKPESPKPVLMEVGPVVESKKLGLMDLTKDTCRWPTNDDMREPEFCGHQPAHGSPYCSHHFFRSLQRSQPQTMEAEEVVVRDRSGFGDAKLFTSSRAA